MNCIAVISDLHPEDTFVAGAKGFLATSQV